MDGGEIGFVGRWVGKVDSAERRGGRGGDDGGIEWSFTSLQVLKGQIRVGGDLLLDGEYGCETPCRIDGTQNLDVGPGG